MKRWWRRRRHKAITAIEGNRALAERRRKLRRERERRVLGLHGTQDEADEIMRRMAGG